jgi:hypothetical protein
VDALEAGGEGVRAAAGGRVRSIHRHVTSDGSFGSSPLRQNIGLGTAGVVARLEILWPVTGATQVFENVPVDRTLRVIEGRDELVPIPLQRTRLGGSAAEARPAAEGHAHDPAHED